MSIFDRVAQMLTRGTIALTKLTKTRALVQVQGLFDETKDGIELHLPFGMSAKPTKGEVILLQLGASRAHLIALLGDDPRLRIPDLQDDEFGFRDVNGTQIVWRKDRLEITTPKKVVVNSTGDISVATQGNLDGTVSGDMKLDVSGNVIIENAASIQLGGAGGKKVVLDGDPVIGGGGGNVQASSNIVTAK